MKDDNDDDIGPDCHFLDLDINLKRTKPRVRRDYIRIYDYCTKRHIEGPTSATKIARSVVISGQPGVGVFLFSPTSRSLHNKPF